jgi:hypothetical protein
LRAGLSPANAVRAFALVREATVRHLGLRHYEVQLIGGFGLLERRLIEMATGEAERFGFGSRVLVRFEHHWEPIGWQIFRRARQLFLTRFET